MRRGWSAALLLAAAAGAGAASHESSPAIHITTLSSRPYLISGGDVLVRIEIPGDAAIANTRAKLNGKDVTNAFSAEGRSHELIGLVSGLRPGDNGLVVNSGEFRGRNATAKIVLTNYPITGPIIAGPQQQPFVCTTAQFKLYASLFGGEPMDGATLGPPTDAQCSAPTKITYLYMPVGGTAFKVLANTENLPADVATTTTLDGVTVKFVVRVETATIDRGIYQSTVLHDPTSEPEPSWRKPPRGWNKRLIAVEGAGCPGGWYHQGTVGGSLVMPGVVDFSLFSPARLGEGYALFGNTLQNASQNCNAVLAGEAAMMGKEHFIKMFGVPRFTVSAGASGGSYGSSQIADALPGLFDGVLISSTFPDPLGIAFSGADGHLLTHYFAANPREFTPEQEVAVSGYKSMTAFLDAANQSGRIDPVPDRIDVDKYKSAAWNPVVPESMRYDPVKNPHGARPTLFDDARNIYGTDPATGFARRPFDNMGVQYGLNALNRGVITPEQFLALNAKIGGYDNDFNYISKRVTGDLKAIQRAYESGLQLNGGGGLAGIPVFDISGSMNEDSGYHYQWFHFAQRERMARVAGDASNHVMWRGNPVPFENAWTTFIAWVEAVTADTSSSTQRAKVIRNKPNQANDGCWSSPTQFIAEPQTFGILPNTRCNALFPSYAFPRYVAGSPLAADIIKCQLKPIDPKDYQIELTSEQRTRLSEIFPQGVCDWSKSGVEQRSVRPWASFGPSNANNVPGS
jgi:Tannase-like family of unknown function (DUF6351)